MYRIKLAIVCAWNAITQPDMAEEWRDQSVNYLFN